MERLAIASVRAVIGLAAVPVELGSGARLLHLGPGLFFLGPAEGGAVLGRPALSLSVSFGFAGAAEIDNIGGHVRQTAHIVM
jgi:hypothetical protein